MYSSTTSYVDVSVATLWSAPNLNRPVDEPSVTNPVHPWAWTRGMTLDEKLWLVGRLETQALLGSRVTIVDTEGDWTKIIIPDQCTPNDPRGYPGWVPSRQLVYNPTFEQMKQGPFVLITKPTAPLYKTPLLGGELMEVSFNTRLPLLEKSDHYMVLLPNGTHGWIRKEDGTVYIKPDDIPPPTSETLIATATKFLGLPYLWGGVSGFGFDCSGFTFAIYQSQGIDIPRDSGPQSRNGIPVEKDSLQPGDLLFFADQRGHVFHVTMYHGNGFMIHAPESAKSIEIISLETPSYIKSYFGARRYI